MRKSEGPTVHVGLPGQEGLSLLKEALDGIASDAANCDGKSDVLLLGRYRHLKPRNMGQLARRYPRPRFSYMNVHRSKGHEADYVVVPGLCAGKHGFPAEIADDPLPDLVLAAPGAYPNAGERRLLYVAITRARRLVHLLAGRGPPPAFTREPLEDCYDVAIFDRLPEDDSPCPKCKGGRLERRENPRDKSMFYHCSNWPDCVHTRNLHQSRERSAQWRPP